MPQKISSSSSLAWYWPDLIYILNKYDDISLLSVTKLYYDRKKPYCFVENAINCQSSDL